MRTLRHIIILAAFALASCETLVDFPGFGDHEMLPVIEAILTDQLTEHSVRVSHSVSLTDTVSSKPIENAMVYITSSIGDSIPFPHDANGWYRSTVWKAHSGVLYKLNVIIDGVNYESKGEIVEMNGIDSLYTKYLPKSIAHEAGYYVYVNGGMADPGNIRYYLFDLHKNGELLTRGSDILLFYDKYMPEFKGVEMPYAFAKSDTVKVELLSLSKPMFDYYYLLGNEMFSINFTNFGYSANPPVMFSPRALGYFQVSAVSAKTIIINPK